MCDCAWYQGRDELTRAVVDALGARRGALSPRLFSLCGFSWTGGTKRERFSAIYEVDDEVPQI